MFHQSYRDEDFGPVTSGTISGYIKSLLNRGLSPEKVVEVLREEGYGVEVDESGYAHIQKGRETCHHPLTVTSTLD